MDLPSKLEEALELLNYKLANKGLFFNITLLGSMALHFTGFEIQRRTDLDIHNSNIEEGIEELILEVSEELGIANDWINNRASSIEPLPKEFESRLLNINKYSRINLNVLSIDDLIKLKVNAIYSREATKDIFDLKLLNPTDQQLDDAVLYIGEQIAYHHGNNELEKKSDELIAFRLELNEKLR